MSFLKVKHDAESLGIASDRWADIRQTGRQSGAAQTLL